MNQMKQLKALRHWTCEFPLIVSRLTRLLILHRSKVMVEEEGEVFRKGTVLLGPEEMEGEYDGEELRIEVRPMQSRLHSLLRF